MKKILFTLTSAILIFLVGQFSEYRSKLIADPGSYRWVSTKSGLNMRTTASTRGKKIKTIPFGIKVELIETKKKTIKIGKLWGKWAQIKTESKTGWVFDAFLSDHKPYKPETLMERFKGISMELDSYIVVTKEKGAIDLRGDGGNCDETVNVTQHPVYIKQNDIFFRLLHSLYTGKTEEELYYEEEARKKSGKEDLYEETYDEEETDDYIDTLHECRIPAEKIMKTPMGGELKTEIKCYEIEADSDAK